MTKPTTKKMTNEPYPTMDRAEEPPTKSLCSNTVTTRFGNPIPAPAVTKKKWRKWLNVTIPLSYVFVLNGTIATSSYTWLLSAVSSFNNLHSIYEPSFVICFSGVAGFNPVIFGPIIFGITKSFCGCCCCCCIICCFCCFCRLRSRILFLRR